MLQRIQTVFLILVIVLAGTSLFFNVYEYHSTEDGGMHYVMSPFGLDIYTDPSAVEETSQPVPYILLAVLAIASITVAAIEITKFRNRLLQIKLGTLNSVILAAATILGVYLATDLVKTKEIAGNYGIFIFLIPAALICNALANRFIHRDEKLVRSVDRIR